MDSYYNDFRDDAHYNQHPHRQNPSDGYPQQQHPDFEVGSAYNNSRGQQGSRGRHDQYDQYNQSDQYDQRDQRDQRDQYDQYRQHDNGYRRENQSYNDRPDPRGYAAHSRVTPGADNFGREAPGRGVVGIAQTVAAQNERDSGRYAMRDPPSVPRPPAPLPQANSYNNNYSYAGQESDSLSSGLLNENGNGGGSSTPSRSANSGRNSPYGAPPPLPTAASYGGGGVNPFQRSSQTDLDIDPDSIADDGDDGLGPVRPQRHSWLSQRSRIKTSAGAAAGAAGGLMALSRGGGGSNGGGGGYDPVSANTQFQDPGTVTEKANMGSRSCSCFRGKPLRKWVIFAVVVLIAVIAVIVTLFATQTIKTGGGGGGDSGAGNSGSGVSADEDFEKNGDLDINSAEIKSLMGNPDLHKVFFGMDYTPMNTQYPDCLHNPPSQNNVTRDVAILSQLTNQVRLYGTDCNQTEMVIHAIRQLQLDNTMKVWLGVWQDGNVTTNDRQLSQMWTVLDEYGQEPFAGLIVANEILFREQMTASTLGDLLNAVRANLTAHNWDLSVSTSDLGDDWNSSINQTSDLVMANIHPFFAGVGAASAASSTMAFWTGVDGQWFRDNKDHNIIAETGWPTKGGHSCGSEHVTTCPDPAVAGVDELNIFLEDWVCPALRNGTQYFWFSLSDEPWKAKFNTPEKGWEWEDQWGLLDVNRNLKAGVKIPDCGGETV